MSLTNLFDLRGHVAVVTGGNGGIGRSSGPGSRGCGYGHNEEKNRRVLEELNAWVIPRSSVPRFRILSPGPPSLSMVVTPYDESS